MRSGTLDIIPLNRPPRTRRLSVKEPATLTMGRVSPDGTYVASLHLAHGARAESLVGVAFDGTELWQVRGESLRVPAISPDGVTLAFADGEQLNLLTVSTAVVRPLGIKGANPAWSPGGDRLAYDHDGNVHVLNVADDHGSLVGRGSEPSWSPDGKSLAVRNGPHEIELVSLETHTRQTLLEADLVSVPRWSGRGEWMMYSYRGGGRWWSLTSAADPHQIMVRETRSGAEESVGVFYKADPGDFTWVMNKTFCDQ